MSGIVGIVNLDGATVNRQLLQQLTAFMTYRGVDAQQVWYSGCVGFGNALLKTTTESQQEHQPTDSQTLTGTTVGPHLNLHVSFQDGHTMAPPPPTQETSIPATPPSMTVQCPIDPSWIHGD